MTTRQPVYFALAAAFWAVNCVSFALSWNSPFSEMFLQAGGVAVVLAGWAMTRALGGTRGCSVGLVALGLAAGLGLVSTCGPDRRGSGRLDRHLYALAFSAGFDGDGYYLLYECNALGLFCTEHRTRVLQVVGDTRTAQLIINKQLRIVSVTLDGQPRLSPVKLTTASTPTPRNALGRVPRGALRVPLLAFAIDLPLKGNFLNEFASAKQPNALPLSVSIPYRAHGTVTDASTPGPFGQTQ